MANFISSPADLRVINLFRRCINGATEPWIHYANPYGGDPVSLTAAYTAAEDGDPASYFIYTPQKKEGSDARMSRKAGAGTWKGERTFPLYAPKDGGRVQVGWKETFSYILKKKTKTEREVRLGWIMHSFRLMNGEDSQGRCLSRVFPSPRISDAPVLLVLDPVPLRVASPIAAAAGTTSDLTVSVDSAAAAITIPSTTVATATRTAPTTIAATATGAAPTTLAATATGAAPTAEALAATGAAPTAEALAAAATAISEALARSLSSTPFATVALPIAATTTVEAASAIKSSTTTYSGAATSPSKNWVHTSATAAATTTPDLAVSVDSAAAAVTIPSTTVASATAAEASPPRKWVQVQISDSPTKSNDKGSAKKRVYQVMLPSDETEIDGVPSSKKMKRIECKGWLTLEPVCPLNIQIS